MTRRLTALILAMALCLLLAPARAETSLPIDVSSAPLIQYKSAENGMVRVYLKSVASRSTLDLTINGEYSVSGMDMVFTTGDQVEISFDAYSGNLTLTADGVVYPMGSEMRLRRHQADGVSALNIYQANRPNNYYPGDLQIITEKKSDGTYRMYPIVHVYIEYYLYGVVPYEMSSSWPAAALQAQAVAARTYTLRLMNGNASKAYDLNDTADNQVYNGFTGNESGATRAVDATRGIVVMNGSALTGTFYTASNGGQTESAKNAWGGSTHPYLVVKDDPFDAMNPNSNRRKRTFYADFDHAEQNAAMAELLTSSVQEAYGSDAMILTIDDVRPHTPKYAAPSRLYTQMDFDLTVQLADGTTRSHTQTYSIFTTLESALDASIQSSNNELWSIEKTDDAFLLTVGRWGHGIGMSQRGTQQMANMGYTYDQILGFYYEGCTRVQHSFTHTILPPGGGDEVITTESPAPLPPDVADQARLTLPDVTAIIALRYTADEQGKPLTGLPNGTPVTVLARGDAWTLVRYGEINGYLPTPLLTFGENPPTVTTESATNITQWAVNTGSDALNFRTAPNYDASVQYELPRNTVLVVLGAEGEFVKVQHGANVGYAAASYLTFHASYPGSVDDVAMPTPTPTPTPTPEPGEERYAIINTESGKLNLRKGPGTGYTVVTTIPKGEYVVVTGQEGNWSAITWGEYSGYVLTSYLLFVENPPTPEPTEPQTPPPEVETTTPPPDEETPTPTPAETPGIPAGTVAFTTASSILRASADETSAALMRIPEGEKVTLIAWGAEYSCVTYGSTTGYLPTTALHFLLDAPTASPTPTPTPDYDPGDPEESVTDAPADDVKVAWVVSTVTAINLRETAAQDANILMEIPSEAQLHVLETGATWSKVRYQGTTGYVFTRHLSYVEPGEALGIRYINTAVDPLAMRSAPTTSGSSIVTRIDRGEAVNLLEDLGDWCKVQYRSYTGYCSAAYLSREKPDAYVEDDTPLYDLTLTNVTGWGAVINSRDGSSLYIRKWCSTHAPTVKEIQHGESVTLLQKGSIWCKISYEGKTGYCLTRELTLTPPAE